MNMEINQKESGFSLIELIITLIILAILSAVIYVKWSESTAELDAQAALFINDLRYAQNLSVSKNERCQLVINSSTSYQIQDSSQNPYAIPSNNNESV